MTRTDEALAGAGDAHHDVKASVHDVHKEYDAIRARWTEAAQAEWVGQT